MPTALAHDAAFSERRFGARALLATTLLLLALTASADGDPLFSAPFLSYDTGGGPWSVAIADLNADGWPDLATANSDESTVSVLLGNGDGTFRAKTDLGTGILPLSVAIADLNADARPDLVTANKNPNTVSVLLGNGDGTFRPKTDFGTGSAPSSVTVADFNADGRADLAVANEHSNTVSVLLGNGNGTFGAKTDFGTGSRPSSVATADLNADGRPDLVTANWNSHTVSVLLGNGDGTFGATTDLVTRRTPVSVAIADLNADGRLDLVAVGPNTVSVLLGNGDGTFGAPIEFGTAVGPWSVAIADLNADGQPDLATANGGFSVSVLLGNGDGTFAARADYGTGQSPYSVAIADLNGDARPDLVVANVVSSNVAVLLGNRDGTFGARTDFGTGINPVSLAIADLNADGQLDLAVANSASDQSEFVGTVSVLLGNGDGTFGTKTDFGAGGTPASLAISDLNADGRPDLVVGNAFKDGDDGSPGAVPATVRVLLGNGDGTFTARTDLKTGGGTVAIADLNADGRPDLAVANGPNTVSVLLGNGDGTFGAGTDFITGYYPTDVALADLNADGRQDLVTPNSVLLGNGDGTFAARTDLDAGGGTLAIADLNADGRLDLALTSGGPGTVLVFLGKGDATFAARTEYGAGRWPTDVAIADLDSDGRPDLAVTNVKSHTVSVLPGDGDGTFGAKTDYGAGVSPSSVAIADLNGDGRLDFVVANYSSSTVSVMLNRSAPPPPLAVAFDLTPGTLNLASRGRWMTGHLEPVAPFAAGDIDVSSIRLNGTVPVDSTGPTALGDHDGNGIDDLMVKFSRAAVELAVSEGDIVPVMVTGTVGGRAFSGTDSIRVRRGRISAPLAGSRLAAGSVEAVRWEMPRGVRVESVALLFSPDGGATWSPIARGQPNTGSYDWTVPNVLTDEAKVAVVVESADEIGGIVEGVLAMSEAFSIGVVVSVGDRRPRMLELAIRGATPNPAVNGRLRVAFTLRDGSPARLVLMDVAGRVVTSEQVGTLGPGRHSVELLDGRALPPGIYFLRLTQGGREARARAAVLR